MTPFDNLPNCDVPCNDIDEKNQPSSGTQEQILQQLIEINKKLSQRTNLLDMTLDSREDFAAQQQRMIAMYNRSKIDVLHINVNIVGSLVLPEDPNRIYVAINIFETTEGAFATPWTPGPGGSNYPGFQFKDSYYIPKRDGKDWCLPCHGRIVQSGWWVAAETAFVCLRIISVSIVG